MNNCNTLSADLKFIFKQYCAAAINKNLSPKRQQPGNSPAAESLIYKE